MRRESQVGQRRGQTSGPGATDSGSRGPGGLPVGRATIGRRVAVEEETKTPEPVGQTEDRRSSSSFRDRASNTGPVRPTHWDESLLDVEEVEAPSVVSPDNHSIRSESPREGSWLSRRDTVPLDAAVATERARRASEEARGVMFNVSAPINSDRQAAWQRRPATGSGSSPGNTASGALTGAGSGDGGFVGDWRYPSPARVQVGAVGAPHQELPSIRLTDLP